MQQEIDEANAILQEAIKTDIYNLNKSEVNYKRQVSERERIEEIVKEYTDDQDKNESKKPKGDEEKPKS